MDEAGGIGDDEQISGKRLIRIQSCQAVAIDQSPDILVQSYGLEGRSAGKLHEASPVAGRDHCLELINDGRGSKRRFAKISSEDDVISLSGHAGGEQFL